MDQLVGGGIVDRATSLPRNEYPQSVCPTVVSLWIHIQLILYKTGVLCICVKYKYYSLSPIPPAKGVIDSTDFIPNQKINVTAYMATACYCRGFDPISVMHYQIASKVQNEINKS